MNMGPTELILILVIALIFFGPSKLPSLGKSLGEAIRGFKKGVNEDFNEDAKNVSPKDQIAEPTDSKNVTDSAKVKDKNNV